MDFTMQRLLANVRCRHYGFPESVVERCERQRLRPQLPHPLRCQRRLTCAPYEAPLNHFHLLAAAAVCTMVAVSMRPSEPRLEVLGLPLDAKYLMLCLSALFWGTAQAGGSVVNSSLADSVPTGTPILRLQEVTCPSACHKLVLSWPLAQSSMRTRSAAEFLLPD